MSASQSDVLFIVSGVAGCAAALKAADLGLTVSLLTNSKTPDTGSNTSWAQGGIIYTGPGDAPELLSRDIVVAGDGIGHAPAIQLLAERGPRLVEEILLQRCRTPFDRREDGSLDLTEEGAHSLPRIIHAGDHTGESIARSMAAEVERNPRIRLLRGVTAVDLILSGFHTKSPQDIYSPPRCLGAYVFDPNEQRVDILTARETILATGGLGQIYLHTTNPRRSRGDGLAMAYRAGARVINLEYIQFHPTSFYHRLAPRFLLSEALRGEGAVLINGAGERFMPKYHELGELAPRDVVARAIHEEMLQSGEQCMYLSIAHKDAGWITERFPMISNYLKTWDIDLARQPVPVVPAAHYSCGGVAVDLHGRTSVASLRAAGEVACSGIHGANRLASTSLLEGLVWGVQAAESIAQEKDAHVLPDPDSIEPWILEHDDTDPALVQQDWMTIRQTMWNYVGLVRTRRNMERALRILRGLQFDVESFYRRAQLSDELIGLRNGAQTALAVVHAALRNRTSRGAHYRKS